MMKLVELIRTTHTSDEVHAALSSFGKAISVICSDDVLDAKMAAGLMSGPSCR